MKPVIVVGSLNVDLVIRSDRFVAPGETMHGTSFSMVSGGKGANQAAASARLGYPTRLFGRVGDDGFAPRLLGDLDAAGVDISAVDTVPGWLDSTTRHRRHCLRAMATVPASSTTRA